MNIRWITSELGTAPADALANASDLYVVDVRDLVDKGGNRAAAVRAKIEEGVAALSQGKRTVVCCDYGISRSNAIACGVLARHLQLDFAEAVKRVQVATGEREIKLEPLNAVRAALGLTKERTSDARRQRRVLLTGGTGFLGGALQRLQDESLRVVAPSRPAADIEAGSTQLDLLAAEGDFDYLVHFANPRVYTSNVAMGTALAMLRNVIDVCVARDITLLYPSGWEVYSGFAGTVLADESTPRLPRGPYGETKYLQELLIEHSCRTRGLRCAMVRSSPVYGPGSSRPKFIYTFMSKAARGDAIVTHRYANGAPALDLLYVDDFANAVAEIARRGLTGTFNLGTGVLTSTREIAERVCAQLKSASRIEFSEIDTPVANIAMDASLARSAFAWRPAVGVDEGLTRVIHEHRERT